MFNFQSCMRWAGIFWTVTGSKKQTIVRVNQRLLYCTVFVTTNFFAFLKDSPSIISVSKFVLIKVKIKFGSLSTCGHCPLTTCVTIKICILPFQTNGTSFNKSRVGEQSEKNWNFF